MKSVHWQPYFRLRPGARLLGGCCFYLIFILLNAGIVNATETTIPSPRNHCVRKLAITDSWLDKTHALVSQKLCEPAMWFDNFFGDERSIEEGRPGTYARWRNEIRWSEEENFQYRTSFNASVKLPKASRKLKLIIAGESKDDPSEILRRDPADIDGAAATTRERTAIGLRYDVREKPKSKFSISAGLRAKLPLQPLARVRYRYSYPLSELALFRITEAVFWKKWEGFGSATRLDIERLLSTPTLARWSTSGTFSEISSGVDWGTTLSMFYKFNRREAMSLDLGASGVTRPRAIVESYRIGARFRRNFHRPWLFYEFEPEVSWPRNDSGQYESIAAITFRIEIQFWHDD